MPRLFFDFLASGLDIGTFCEERSGGLGMSFLVLTLFLGWLGVWRCYIDLKINDHVGFCR